MLNLGPRLSEQDYSSDDRKLLDNLAAQAAPALRVGQLVREQEAEAATRQRFEHELEVARLIQQHFLPARAARPARLGGRRVLPARARGRRRLLRRDPAGRRPRGVRRRRRHRQGRARRAGHVRHPQRPARVRAAADRARRGAPAGQRAPVPGHAGEDVRHLPVCACSTRAPGVFRFANAGHDLPYVKTADGVDRAARARHAAGPDAGHGLRGERGRARARRLPAAALGRDRRGARPAARDVRVPAPEGDRRRRARAGRR